MENKAMRALAKDAIGALTELKEGIKDLYAEVREVIAELESELESLDDDDDDDDDDLDD